MGESQMKKNLQEKCSYYSVPQVGALLGISRIAVYRRIRTGEIKAIKIGRNYAIHCSYVRDIVGEAVSPETKRIIRQAVKKTVKQYGPLLLRLGRE
jgi:excisionase family DNA binding protein